MNFLLLNILDTLGSFFSSEFARIIKDIFCFIPKIMYFLVACLISIVDLFQIAFRKIAGLDPIMLDGEVTTGDSVYQIIMDALFNNRYPAIGTIFWSLIVLGVFMLIVTAIIATIRVEYNPDKDKGNSKEGIIRNFLKGLFSLFIIPIASIFGMYLTNSLVQVIDTITAESIVDNNQLNQYFDPWGTENIPGEFQGEYSSSFMSFDIFGINIPTKTEPFSGLVFKASAYSCNRFRLYEADYLLQVNNSSTNLGIFDGKLTDSGTAADLIDTAFAINANLKGDTKYSINTEDTTISTKYYSQGLVNFFGKTDNLTSFSKYNVEFVWYFYDLWTFNYIVGFVGLIAIGKLYATFCLMLFSRIFEILSLFLFSPVVVGIMPMDNGGSLNRWRMQYAAKFALVLIMVFGMNMVSPVMTVMQQIKFFGQPLLDYIVTTIMLVAAMTAVNTLTTSFSTILFDKVGTEAYNSSLKNATEARSGLQSGLNMARSTAHMAASVPLKAAQLGAKVGVGLGKLGYAGVQKFNDRRNGIRKKDEKESIKNDLKFDAAKNNKIQNELDLMSAAERKNHIDVDNFLKTDAGKKYLSNFNEGSDADNLAAARLALENNDFTGLTLKAGVTEADQRNILNQHLHEKEVFSHTKAGESLAYGSKEYNEALNVFNGLKDKEKVELLMEGQTSLNNQQANIRAKRNIIEQKREHRFDNIKNFGGKVKSAYGTASNTVNKVFSPFASTLQNMINLIPGMELFSKKGDGNKK